MVRSFKTWYVSCPLPGQNHDVAFAGLFERPLDGSSAIRFDHVRHIHPPDSHQGVVHDRQRIFRSRIVAGEDYEIAGFRGGLSHQRALGAIAIAAASEERDDALGIEPARHRDGIAQRIVGVSIIHRHYERLALIHALESSGN